MRFDLLTKGINHIYSRGGLAEVLGCLEGLDCSSWHATRLQRGTLLLPKWWKPGQTTAETQVAHIDGRVA